MKSHQVDENSYKSSQLDNNQNENYSESDLDLVYGLKEFFKKEWSLVKNNY